MMGFGNESLYVAAICLIGEFLPHKEIAIMNGVLASGMFVANAAGSLLAVPVLSIGGTHGLCACLGAAALLQFFANLEALRQRHLIEAKEQELVNSKHDFDEIKPLLYPFQIEATEEEAETSQQISARGMGIFVSLVVPACSNTICVWNLNMILCPLLLETWPAAKGERAVLAEEIVGAWSFLFMMVPAIGSPIIGAIVGALGCPGLFIFLSQCMQTVGIAVLSLAAHGTSLTHFSGPLLPLLLISGSNPFLFPMLYQCITLVVPSKHCAKAMGLMSVMQNTCMGLWPLIVAQMRVVSGSYESCTLAFFGAACVGLMCWCGMLVLDSQRLGGSSTLSQRSAYFDKLLAPRTARFDKTM